MCKCGCGYTTRWDATNKKFRDYVHGHQARVKNNWGHNPKAREMSLKTRRERFTSGELTTWNSGLTKETDARVAANGVGRAASITDVDRKSYSDRMQSLWKTGAITAISGSDHPMWKGGVASLNQLARVDRRLYTDWKYPILERDGFQCTKCGSTDSLHVHHNLETFSEVMMKVVTESDLLSIDDNDVKRALVARITDYHITTPVTGITLCHGCHAELHPSLNFKP